MGGMEGWERGVWKQREAENDRDESFDGEGGGKWWKRGYEDDYVPKIPST